MQSRSEEAAVLFVYIELVVREAGLAGPGGWHHLKLQRRGLSSAQLCSANIETLMKVARGECSDANDTDGPICPISSQLCHNTSHSRYVEHTLILHCTMIYDLEVF